MTQTSPAVAEQDLNLAVIGNCRIAATITPKARINWCCFPTFDADPIFCSLLGGEFAGEYGFSDVEIDGFSRAEQEYVQNTPILTTTLYSDSGEIVRVSDFAPHFIQMGRTFRPPMLIRKIEPVNGQPRIRIRVRPAANYGAMQPSRMQGSNHCSYVAAEQSIRMTTSAPVSYITSETLFVLQEAVYIIIHPNEGLAAPVAETCEAFRRSTRNYWQSWVRSLSVPFEWQDAVIRAAITVKLCSFEETGAIIAAITTSIPEAPNTERNWDYRYCWLRDAYFVVQALNKLSATLTMEDYIHFITTVSAQEPDNVLKPVYGIVPSKALTEHIAEALPGFRGMGPVRVGNAAVNQVQNDSYGNIVMAAAQMFFDRRLVNDHAESLFARLEGIGTKAAEVALTPDAGIWEYRGRQRVHTFSAMMCWAACDRLAKIATRLGKTERHDHWRTHARKIRAAILEQGICPERNCLVESFGGKDMDGALLLAHEVGFLSAKDPIFLSTLEAIEKELKKGHLLYRYAAPDDFGAPDTAFTVCTFWYIDALAAVGRIEEAREIFEKLLGYRNHVGLLSEDIDPKTGALWGNFPQTYSMVGLINSAMRLSKSWEEAFWRGS